MDLAAVMDELGDRLATINGLRVHRWPPDNISPPAAIVSYPDSYEFDSTYSRGMDRVEVPVVVVVGKVSERAARARLSGYIAGSGPASVKHVLERAVDPSWLEVAAGSNVFTPLDGALQITGDVDLRAEITPEDWTPAANQAILGRWLTAGGAAERSYRMDLLTNGRLRFTWSVTGQVGAANIASTAPVTPPASGRLAVRATFDVDNGAGGRTIRFYTAPSIAGPWTQLGDPVTQGGVTSIHPGTAPLTVGAYNAGAQEPLIGRVWAAEVRDGIDGSPVAAVDFTGLAEGTTAFTDATGRDWTIAGNARIVADPARPYTAIDSPRVTRVDFDVVTIAGTDYLAATFTVDIAAKGAVP